MATKRGLGRGFDSLIPTDVLEETFDPTADQDERTSELRNIAIDEITADAEQPRRHFDELALQELATSIKQHGVLQPIIVAPKSGGKFLIVAGERRFRAAQLAGLTKVPCIVRTLNNQHKLELALIENIQRRDLNPLEIATAYLKLHEQFNLTYEEIGQRVGGKAVSTISNLLRLLQLPSKAKTALVNGQISEGHARQLLALEELSAQNKLLNLIIKNGWSVRKTEQYVVGYKQGKPKGKSTEHGLKKTQTETEQTKRLEKQLATSVRLKTTARGGQLLLSFKDDTDLERIIALLIK